MTFRFKKRRLVGGSLAFILISLVAGACSSGHETAAESRSTTSGAAGVSGTPTTDDGAADRSEIEAAYRRASEAYLAASAASDPDLPALAETHADPMLAQRRDVLTARRLDGRAARMPDPSQYRIEIERFEVVDSTSARLTACVVDDAIVYEVATGNVVNDDVTTARHEAVMRLIDGTWKLVERRELEDWAGVAGCAVD
jgi:hypothetical protein